MRIALIYILLSPLLLSGLSACNTTQGEQELPPAHVSIEKSISELRKNALTSFKNGQYERAAESYYSILQKLPDDDDARLGLSESYFKMGQGAQAQEHFERLLLTSDYKAEALQGIGLSLLQQGNTTDAHSPLEDAVKDDERLWRAWNGLAQIHDSKNQWEQAAYAYETALKYTDRPEVIYNNMGVSYMTQEKFVKAAEAFRHALDYKPDLEAAKTNHQLALAMQTRYDEASLEHNNVQDEAKALNNAGYTAMRRGDYAGAERLFLKAIETNPSFYKPAYNNLQILYFLKNKKSQQN